MAAAAPQSVPSVAHRKATSPRPDVPSASHLKLALEGLLQNLSEATRTPSPFGRRLCLHCCVLGVVLVGSIADGLAG